MNLFAFLSYTIFFLNGTNVKPLQNTVIPENVDMLDALAM